jgi:hypothetical protein
VADEPAIEMQLIKSNVPTHHGLLRRWCTTDRKMRVMKAVKGDNDLISRAVEACSPEPLHRFVKAVSIVSLIRIFESVMDGNPNIT